MTEFVLNTKIFHEGEKTLTAQTGDNNLIFILFLIAIISAIIVFKKKFVKILLSFILVCSVIVICPKKSFADENVSITSVSEVSKDKPAQLTVTNNDNYAISINNITISNRALLKDATWDIAFVKDKYEIKEAGKTENVSFDIAPHSSFTFSISPNVEDIPVGELCDIRFKAVSTHYNASFKNDEDKVQVNNDFDFSFSTFENSDNTKVNREIASIEAAFASIPNTYNNIILDNANYAVSERTAFMRTLGFEDNIYCKL